MPAELLNDPPGIACAFSDGRQKRWLSGGAGDPALVADLLTGLAGQVHPHGTVNAPGTVYLPGARHPGRGKYLIKTGERALANCTLIARLSPALRRVTPVRSPLPRWPRAGRLHALPS